MIPWWITLAALVAWTAVIWMVCRVVRRISTLDKHTSEQLRIALMEQDRDLWKRDGAYE